MLPRKTWVCPGYFIQIIQECLDYWLVSRSETMRNKGFYWFHVRYLAERPTAKLRPHLTYRLYSHPLNSKRELGKLAVTTPPVQLNVIPLWVRESPGIKVRAYQFANFAIRSRRELFPTQAAPALSVAHQAVDLMEV